MNKVNDGGKALEGSWLLAYASRKALEEKEIHRIQVVNSWTWELLGGEKNKNGYCQCFLKVIYIKQVIWLPIFYPNPSILLLLVPATLHMQPTWVRGSGSFSAIRVISEIQVNLGSPLPLVSDRFEDQASAKQFVAFSWRVTLVKSEVLWVCSGSIGVPGGLVRNANS